MNWEGQNIIFVVFCGVLWYSYKKLQNLTLIMRRHQTQIEEDSTKYLTGILQKYEGHKRQEETEELPQIRRG